MAKNAQNKGAKNCAQKNASVGKNKECPSCEKTSNKATNAKTQG